MSDRPPLAFALRRVRLDLVAAHRAAHGSVTNRQVIIVEVTDGDGNVGWGECSALAQPHYTSEYLDGCWQILTTTLIPAILAAPPTEILPALERTVGHHMARAALITALLDLDLRTRNQNLRSALGEGNPGRDRVAARAVIPFVDAPADILPLVDDALRAGFGAVKLKIAPGRDLAMLRVVRSSWPTLSMAADANGSYPDSDTAQERLGGPRGIERLDLDYLEQPLAADDLVGSAILARRIGVRIALDESIATLGELISALALNALQVVNVKPARVGGPLAAMTIAQVAVERGCDVFCGGMLETGIGRAAALAFAAQPVCSGPTDLGPSKRYFADDITDDVTMTDGQVNVPAGAGIGVAPDLDRLDAATIERWEPAL